MPEMQSRRDPSLVATRPELHDLESPDRFAHASDKLERDPTQLNRDEGPNGLHVQPSAGRGEPQSISTRDSNSLSTGRAKARSVARSLAYPAAIYGSSRVLLLLVAIVGGALQHASLSSELSNWDGVWYIRLAVRGYPTHVLHYQTTLGFFPGFSMTMWALARVLAGSLLAAGLVVSGVGGFIATVIVQRLASRWWGDKTARKAVLAFCIFPGSVVFSMVYSEGMLIPLAAGCLLALEKRRYLMAGFLAAAATTIGPDAIAIVPACLVGAIIEIRRSGWKDPYSRRSMLSVVMAPIGIACVGAFFWVWTGTPLASYDAQHFGWHEGTSLLALYHQGQILAREFSQRHFTYHDINLNYVVALGGAAFLIVALILLARERHNVSAVAITWTLGISFLAITSAHTPPNPRLLITAFPVVIVLAKSLGRKTFAWLSGLSVTLLVAMSAVTYVGIALRP